MSIVYKMLPDGGFLAGDTETRRTSYAFATSPFALLANKSPEKIATEMMRERNLFSWNDLPPYEGANAEHWRILKEEKTK
jgi:hypothetical protein